MQVFDATDLVRVAAEHAQHGPAARVVRPLIAQHMARAQAALCEGFAAKLFGATTLHRDGRADGRSRGPN
jgi:hypothetical protein